MNVNGQEIAEARYRMANLWQFKGKIQQAMKGYRETLLLSPDYTPARLELGNLLIKQGDIGAAIKLYREAMAMSPKETIFQEKLQCLLNNQTVYGGDDSNEFRATAWPESEGSSRNGRILLYTDSPGVYGAGQCNHLLMTQLAEKGYHCTFAQPKAHHHLIEARQALGIKQVWIEHDDLYDMAGEHRSLWDDAEALKIFANQKPDLIIFSDGCPVSNLAAKAAAGRMGIPYVVVVHCVTASWAIQFSEHLETLHHVYCKAARVVAVSTDNLSLLREWFHLPIYQGEVLHNGVAERFFAPFDISMREQVRQDLGVPLDGVVSLTVGRMETVKGYQYQLRAIERLKKSEVWPRLYFAWAGTGTMEPRLRAWARRLGVEGHIKFLGERDDISDVLNAADMFVLTSQFEGMPLSIAEAMAKGLPVAASGISGIPEELGHTGMLLSDPSKDSDALISQLAETIQSWAANPEIRRTVGRECKKRAEDLFKMEHSFQKYLRHIEQVLVEHKSGFQK